MYPRANTFILGFKKEHKESNYFSFKVIFIKNKNFLYFSMFNKLIIYIYNTSGHIKVFCGPHMTLPRPDMNVRECQTVNMSLRDTLDEKRSRYFL
jgi:hypothetical protein